MTWWTVDGLSVKPSPSVVRNRQALTMCVNTLGVFCPSCPVTTVCCVTAHACNSLLPPLVHLAGCLLWCGLSQHPLVTMVPVASPWCASLWSLAMVLLNFSSNMVPPLGASYDLQKVRAAHAGATPMWLHPGRSVAKGEADSWHFSVQAERAEDAGRATESVRSTGVGGALYLLYRPTGEPERGGARVERRERTSWGSRVPVRV